MLLRLRPAQQIAPAFIAPAFAACPSSLAAEKCSCIFGVGHPWPPKKTPHCCGVSLVLSNERRLCLPAVATAATAAIAAAATAAAATAARRLRLRFVHLDLATVKRSAVQLRDRSLRFGIARHFDEAETFALTGVAIADDRDRRDRAALAESVADALFVSGV